MTDKEKQFVEQVQRTREGLLRLLEQSPEQQSFPIDDYKDSFYITMRAFIEVGSSFRGSFENYKRFAEQARELGYELPDIPLEKDENYPIYSEEQPIPRSKLSTAINILDAYLSVQKLREQVRQLRLLSLADKSMGGI